MEPIEVERRYCPDCGCYVQAELVKADDMWEWNCLECGCCIEWYEV